MHLEKHQPNYAFVVIRLAQIANEINALAPRLFTPSNYQDARRNWINRAVEGDFTAPQFVYDRKLLGYAQNLGREFEQLRNLYESLDAGFALRCATPSTNLELLAYVLRLLKQRLCSVAGLFSRTDALLRLPDELLSPHVLSNHADWCEVPLPTPEESERWRRLAERWSPERQAQGGAFEEDDLKALANIKLDASMVVAVFERVLREQRYVSLSSGAAWHAEISDAVSAITVSGEQAKILVPTTRVLDTAKMASLIAHEVGGHVRARLNTESLFIQILTEAYGDQSPLLGLVPLLAKSPDESLNEGAAKLGEVELLGTSKAPAPFYGVAIDMAFRQDASFSDVAKCIYQYRREAKIKPASAAATAWGAAYRVFRGGGCTKGAAYRRGFEQLMQFKADDPKLASTLINYATLTASEIQYLLQCGAQLDGRSSRLGRPVFPQTDIAGYWLREQLARLTD